MAISGLCMLVEPVLRHVARQGMWLGKACGWVRHVVKQGIWPGKAYGQIRHVAMQGMWPTLTDRLKETLAFYRTTVESCRKFMNILLASGNCTPH
jgi:hypothetical protein